MTTPPTPEAKLISVAAALVRGLPMSPQYKKRPLPLWMHRQVAGCEEWARALGVEVRIASDALKAERDQALERGEEWRRQRDCEREAGDEARAERDQALARVKELQGRIRHLDRQWRATQAQRDAAHASAEKAEARVAVMLGIVHDLRGKLSRYMLVDPFNGEDQAAKAMVVEMHRLREDNSKLLMAYDADLHIERDKLKAQLDVAVEVLTLYGGEQHYQGMCKTQSMWDTLGKEARDALAKIKAQIKNDAP